jgi:hypothetical protein
MAVPVDALVLIPVPVLRLGSRWRSLESARSVIIRPLPFLLPFPPDAFPSAHGVLSFSSRAIFLFACFNSLLGYSSCYLGVFFFIHSHFLVSFFSPLMMMVMMILIIMMVMMMGMIY